MTVMGSIQNMTVMGYFQEAGSAYLKGARGMCGALTSTASLQAVLIEPPNRSCLLCQEDP